MNEIVNPQILYVDRPAPDPQPVTEAAPAKKGQELQKLHALLRGRYHWAILLALCLGLPGAIVGYRFGQKTYQSGGVIRVMPIVPKILYSVDEKGEIPAFDTFVDAQVALLKSQRVVNKALDDQAWTGMGITHSDQTVASVMNRLDVSRQGDMISVKATDADPQVAMISVNTIISAYTKIYDEIEAESDDKRRVAREEYRTKLNNEYGNLKQQILDIAKAYGSNDLKPQYDFELSELNKLDAEIGTLQRSLADTSIANHPTTAPASGGSKAAVPHEMTPDDVAAVSREMAQLLEDQTQAEHAVRQLKIKGMLDMDPEMQTAMENLKQSKDAVDEYFARYKAEHGSIVGRIGLTSDEIAAQIKTLQTMRDAASTKLLTLGGEELEIETLRDKAEGVKAQLDETNHVIEQMDLESQVTGRISVINEADKPLAPYRDTRPTYAGAGGLAGTVAGVGSIMLIGLVGRRLDHPEDAQTRIVGIPLLGVLAQLPEDLADPDQAAIASHCVHQIRTLLQIMGQGAGHQVFGVTSPTAGSGKTSLTLAMGLSFSAAHLNTLLIDCDLVGGGLTDRIKTIARQKLGQILLERNLISEEQLILGLQAAQQTNRLLGEILTEQGLLKESDIMEAVVNQNTSSKVFGVIDALAGRDLGSCIQQTGIDRLSILPLGDASPQHAGRLAPAAFHRMIETARKQYDVVLIDTGPVPASLEASVVASQVDAVVLTVSRGEQAGFVDASISHLVSVNAKIAGLVFNRAKNVDVLRFGSSGNSYRSTTASGARLENGVGELSLDSERFGPVARAVASYIPPVRSKAG